MGCIKKICLIFMFSFLAVMSGFSLDTCASEPEELTEEPDAAGADSIVKIVTAYVDESGNIYYAKQGTGFVIGVSQGKSESKKYIVSDYGIVQSEAVYLDAIRKRYGLSEDIKLTATYYAIGNMGVLSQLKIYSFSDETRYVVLEPSGVLADKTYIKLGRGESVVKDARIHIDGYSGARNIVSESSVDQRMINTYDTVITDVMTETYYNDTITYFHVGEIIDEGMAGAPVLDKDGCVIGMFIMQNGNIRAMSVESIRVILDALAINYMVAEDDTSYDVPTQAQKAELKELIVDNKEYMSSIVKNRYTTKTWEALYSAISKADNVIFNYNATAKQYDDSIAELKKARKKLKTKVFKWILINIIAGVVILALLFVLCRILKRRRKLRLQKEKLARMSMRG